jgi:ABC-type oligopeptide transport system ATPase subunit
MNEETKPAAKALTPEQQKKQARDAHYAELKKALAAEQAAARKDDEAFKALESKQKQTEKETIEPLEKEHSVNVKKREATYHQDLLALETSLKNALQSAKTPEEKAAAQSKYQTAKTALDTAYHADVAALDQKLASDVKPYREPFENAKWEHNKQVSEHNYKITNLRFALRSIDITYKQDLVDNHIIMSVDHLKQFFSMGGDSKTKAVHDVSFQIKEGECFGLVGESGCGKTTTGRCLIKLYDITSGSIYYKGYRISGGTRWHEKEIKWSKIHTKEKVAALRNKEAEEISAIPLASLDLQNQLSDLDRQEAEEIKEKNDPSNDDNDIVIGAVKADYAKQREELNALLDAAKGNEQEQEKKIRSYYEGEIAKLRNSEKEHLQEQKDAIRHIKYDNGHINGLRIEDPLVLPEKGQNPTSPSSHRLINEIQMIFQDPVDSLDPRMTVEDIIEEGLHIQHHYNRAENQQKVADMLDKVGLIPEYASRYPHEFSGGQRQRIGIARALVMNPRFLISICSTTSKTKWASRSCSLPTTSPSSNTSAIASPSCITETWWNWPARTSCSNTRCIRTPNRCSRPFRSRILSRRRTVSVSFTILRKPMTTRLKNHTSKKFFLGTGYWPTTPRW